MPSTRQVSGARAERRVRLHYLLRGYRVLDSNVRAGGNELDVIVRRGNRLVFCEVKMRAGSRFGDPLEAVGFEKERRLRRAAERSWRGIVTSRAWKWPSRWRPSAAGGSSACRSSAPS
jgi:putative endonuclease